MGQYIIRRGLQVFLVAVLFMVVVFFLTQVLGDPTGLMLMEGFATETEVAALRHQLGLDLPILIQLWDFFAKLLVGDLGNSWISNRPVLDILIEVLPNTLMLAIVGATVCGVMAVPIGLYCAVKEGSAFDYFMRFIVFVGQSMPVFWIGLMMILLFAVKLPIFPPGGKSGWESFVLPSFVIAIYLLVGLVRLLRSSALEILETEFIKLARLKGLPKFTILFKHVLRNAGVTVSMFLGIQFAMLVTRSVVTESVYSWPGFGRELLFAIYERDFPVVRGALIVGCLMFLLIQFGVDILAALINPQIRHGAATR